MAAPTTIPTLLRWVLVDEDPLEEAIWIAKAIPRAWLSRGQHVAVCGAPTAAGPIEVCVDSAIDDGHIDARHHLAAGCRKRVVLRLRAPRPYRVVRVEIDGERWDGLDVERGRSSYRAPRRERSLMACYR